MEADETAITVETALGTLGTYHGETIGVAVLTAAGAEAAARTMQYLSDLTAYEVDVADAPDYARQTFVADYSIVGLEGQRRGVLDLASGETAVFNTTGAASTGAFAFYVDGVGADNTLQIISVNRFAPSAGYSAQPVVAPNGFASVTAEPRSLVVRVNSLEARTVPDAADGAPAQVWTTDGMAGSWEDLPPSGGITVSAIVADADLAGGGFTSLDIVDTAGAVIATQARAVVVGFDVVALDGDDTAKVWTITASGACTLKRQLLGGEIVSTPFNHVLVGTNVTGSITDDATGLSVPNGPTYGFPFVTEVRNLRTHMYVGDAHDGGGTVDYIDQSRSGDDPGYYMATDNAELLVSGSAFPTSGAMMIALRNQAAGDGEGITGFYHARRMPVGLTFTITTPLGDITVTPANYGSPAPVAGDVCLVNGLTVDGQWQDSNIQQSEDLRIGDTVTWSTIGSGMFTDFVDITGGGGSGDVATDTIFDAKGDLAVGTGSNTAAKLTVGANGTMLTADSGETTGAKWVAPATMLAATTTAATGKTTPVDADELPIADSAASYALKKLTWANVKATAKTYFDTLYATVSHTHAGPVVGGQDEGTSITNTTTPTSLLDSTISVTATAGQVVSVQGCVAYVNNSGTTRAPTLALKLGSTTVLTLTHNTIQASASTRSLEFSFTIRVEANSDINASGQSVSLNSSGAGVVVSGRGTSTEAIQSGVALDLIWTHATTDATQTATLDYVTVMRWGGAGAIS